MTSLLKGVNQNGKNKTEHAKDYDEDYIPEVEGWVARRWMRNWIKLKCLTKQDGHEKVDHFAFENAFGSQKRKVSLELFFSMWCFVSKLYIRR